MKQKFFGISFVLHYAFTKSEAQTQSEQHSLIPTRHILKLGQDHLASLFDAQGTPLASLFDVKGPPLFSVVVLI